MKNILFSSFLCLSLSMISMTERAEKYSYALDAENSVIEWNGSTDKVSHQGSFAVNSQGIEVVDGKVVGGTFIIPIASIKNYDLPKTIKPILLKHLKSEDFFHMALYPEAIFTITKVSSLDSPPEGAVAGANSQVTGKFTLLGNTHPVTFPARITVDESGLDVDATFTIDRTKWGMTYASRPEKKKRYIYSEVDIHLKIAGVPNQL